MTDDPALALAQIRVPPSIRAIVGGLFLTPLLIGGALSLVEGFLGLGFLLVGLPVCLLAIPVVIAIRRRVAFRLRNALLMGVIGGLAVGGVLSLGSNETSWDARWSVDLMLCGLGMLYAAVAYGLMKAIDKLRDR